MFYLKNRYFVKMPYETFFSIDKINAYKIRRKDDIVTFYTTKKSLLKLTNYDDAIVIDRLKEISINLLKKYFMFFLFFLIVISIMLTSSFFIRDIEFKTKTIFNYDINNSIKEELEKVGFIYYLDISVNDLNKKLRKSYPHFAYIGVVKVGSKLVVEIIEQELFEDKNNEENSFGDIIAGSDGYIVKIKSSKGVLTVTTSQSVKKGELLISGNLNYKTNPNDLNKLVKPEGIILASTASYEKIVVPKKIVQKSYNGNIITRYSLTFLNKQIIGQEYNLENSGHIIYENLFSLKNFISFKKIKIYEEVDVVTCYDYNDAFKYAESKIINSFLLRKIDKDEKIVSIDLIICHEEDDFFEFSFLVNKIQNIGEYKKYD